MTESITIQIPLLLICLIPLFVGLVLGVWISRRHYFSKATSQHANHQQADTIARQMVQFTHQVAGYVNDHRSAVGQIEESIESIDQSEKQSLSKAVALLAQMSEVNQNLQAKLGTAEETLLKQADQLSATISEARTDGLTKLFNRRAFDEQLKKLYANWERKQSAFSLILFDIDHFKSVNDTHGHVVGDQVIKHIAKTLAHVTRESDYVARYGGEEFAVLLPDTTLEAAKEIATRAMGKLRSEKVKIDELSLDLTTSCGVCSIDQIAEVEQFVASTDKALYQAKASGRNCGCSSDGKNFHFFGTASPQENTSDQKEKLEQEPDDSFQEVCDDLRGRLQQVIQ
jgi:diguanylate cyclase